MKKIKLTESQVAKLLNEDSFATIKRIYYSDIKKLKSGKGTLDTSAIRGIVNGLYDAIKGMGTDNDAITSNLNKCKNLHDFKNVRNKFYSTYNEKLLDWLDGDIDGDGEWTTTVLRPLQRIYDASTEAGHFKEEAAQDETEKNIMSKFPCLGDTPGYKFDRAKDGILYFKINTDDYAVKVDGTLLKHDGTQWTTFPEKTKCVGAKYQDVSEQDINEQGIDLSPGVEKETTTTTDTSTGNTETSGTTDTETKTGTEEKPKVVTRLMTGSDVKEIQTILHKQGFGEIVGSIDGKLGKKTLAGIKQLFLGVTRPKIEAITLKPKGIKPLTKTEPTTQLAEEIQKNFKRFL